MFGKGWPSAIDKYSTRLNESPRSYREKLKDVKIELIQGQKKKAKNTFITKILTCDEYLDHFGVSAPFPKSSPSRNVVGIPKKKH